MYWLLVMAMLALPCSGASLVKEALSDEALLELVEQRTFQYFWQGAEPRSGLARERIHLDEKLPSADQRVVTVGGSGFGLLALLAGMERGYITRSEGLARLRQGADFLKQADRFHGAWPHWLQGETGKVKPFSRHDDGADIVETAFLVQGLLAARQYFCSGNAAEQALAADLDRLWREVEWDWFTRGGQKVLYWHWSPNYGWKMDFAIRGYNECLILYVLAASSPTHGVGPEVYHEGWARSGAIKKATAPYGWELPLRHNGAEACGGPLFWAHYSFVGLDPRGLSDRYADYWAQNRNQTLINRQWCVENPGRFAGYSAQCWGLTASYSPGGYRAHAPGLKSDYGVIAPTAALSSLPYTPEHSMAALRHFYQDLGDQIFGPYGFYDAFSVRKQWYPQRYLAIDQGPVVAMIENYRSQRLWKLFMSCPEIEAGLKRLGFSRK